MAKPDWISLSSSSGTGGGSVEVTALSNKVVGQDARSGLIMIRTASGLTKTVSMSQEKMKTYTFSSKSGSKFLLELNYVNNSASSYTWSPANAGGDGGGIKWASYQGTRGSAAVFRMPFPDVELKKGESWSPASSENLDLELPASENISSFKCIETPNIARATNFGVRVDISLNAMPEDLDQEMIQGSWNYSIRMGSNFNTYFNTYFSIPDLEGTQMAILAVNASLIDYRDI